MTHAGAAAPRHPAQPAGARAVAAGRDAAHERTGRAVEIVGIDHRATSAGPSSTQIGGTGVFVSALREALLAGEVDFAVHSLKDLPTAPAAGIVLAAVPPREDPRDALVARDGAQARRAARRARGRHRLAAPGGPAARARPGLRVVPIRGNVGHPARQGRLRRARRGGARPPGLARIGRLDEVTEVLEPEQMLPAPGQGALAVECRADEPETGRLLAALDDPASRAAVTAERSLLAALEAGCTAPVGAYAPGPTSCGCRPTVMSADGSRTAASATAVRPGRPTRRAAWPRARRGAAAARVRRDLSHCAESRTPTSSGNDVQ